MLQQKWKQQEYNTIQYNTNTIQNGAARYLIFLTGVREILLSDLGPETGSPGLGFLWFSSDPEANSRIVTQVGQRPLASVSFPVHYFI
jgi:hypothetical protein